MSISRFEHGFVEALFESDDIGLALVDSQLRYVRVNDTLAEINGVPAAGHEGKTVRQVLPTVADLLEPLLRQIVESGEPLENLQLSGPTPADPEADRHFHGAYYPIVEDDTVIGVGAVVVEITQRVRTQRELLEQAHQIYETVVQELTVAQLALDEGEREQAYEALGRALTEAKHIASKVMLEEMLPRG